MKKLMFLVLILLFSSLVFATWHDPCYVYSDQSVSYCNDRGGIVCANAVNERKCKCLFEENYKDNCRIEVTQTVDVSGNSPVTSLDISSGFLYFKDLNISSGVKLHFINKDSFSTQAHFLSKGGTFGMGYGIEGKNGGIGGKGGGVASGGSKGQIGEGDGGGSGNPKGASPGAAIGIIADHINLHGEISVSAKDSGGGGGSCSTCKIDNWGKTGAGGGGAGGAGGGLLVISTDSFSIQEGHLTADGSGGGGGGGGCKKCFSSNHGGGGGGGGGGAGGLIYFERNSGGIVYGSTLSYKGAGGGGAGAGKKNAKDGKKGEDGPDGNFIASGDWSLNDFLDVSQFSLEPPLQMDLNKFWDYPETFQDNYFDISRISKNWMRGLPYHTTFLNSEAEVVMEIKRKFAPVLFFADFTSSTNLIGYYETIPPFAPATETIENLKGVSSGKMLMIEASVIQHFYDTTDDSGPVTRTVYTDYDPDMFAPTTITTYDYKLDGTPIKSTTKTIYNKKSILGGYRGSKAKELFGINPTTTNIITGIENYVNDVIISRDEVTYEVFDLETGESRPLTFYNVGVVVGLKNTILTDEFMVSCNFPSQGDSCSSSFESTVSGSPYSFVYEVYSNKTDFKCLRSSTHLDISNWVTECDVAFGRKLPDYYMLVLKRTDKTFFSEELNGELDGHSYSEVLSFNNFGRPSKTRNFDGTVINIVRNNMGGVEKQWFDESNSEQKPNRLLTYNKYGLLSEEKLDTQKYPNYNYYDFYKDKIFQTKFVSDTDSFASPTMINDFDLDSSPRKFIKKLKLGENIYSEEIFFKDSNEVILQRQVKESGNSYIVIHFDYKDGKLWREYSPVRMNTDGSFIELADLPAGTNYKEYAYSDDATQRLLSIKYEDENSKTYDYDSVSIPTAFGLYFPRVTVTEPNGVKTRYTFGLADNLLKVEQDFGTYYTTIASSEDNINELRIYDPLYNTGNTQRVIRIVKDGLGNVLRREHFDSGIQILKYDELFRSLSTQTPTGSAIAYYYRGTTKALSSKLMEKVDDFVPVFNCINFDCSCSSEADCLNEFTCGGGGDGVCG